MSKRDVTPDPDVAQSFERVVEMRVSGVVGDKLIVFASKPLQMLARLLDLLLVTVEPHNLSPILCQLAEV